MAYTLLDAAYEMYYPKAEFAALGGKKTSLLKRLGRGAKRGARAAGRGARAAGGFAMRNKGKLAMGGAGLAGVGLLGLGARKLRQNAVSAGLSSQPGMNRMIQVAKSSRKK